MALYGRTRTLPKQADYSLVLVEHPTPAQALGQEGLKEAVPRKDGRKGPTAKGLSRRVAIRRVLWKRTS